MEKTTRRGSTVAHIEIRQCPLNVSTVFCYSYLALTEWVFIGLSMDTPSGHV